MPTPYRLNPEGTAKDYVQPVLTSYTTWSNNPTFGVRVSGMCNVRGNLNVINNYRSDWAGTRELWWALSASKYTDAHDAVNRDRTFYLTCGPGATQGGYSRPNILRFTFEHPVKLEAFVVPFSRMYSNSLNYTWSIYRVDVASDDTFTRKLLARHVITRDDAAETTKTYTFDVPVEKQEYSFVYDLELTQVNAGWASNVAFIRPDVKIRAKYTAQSLATTRGWEPVIGRLPDGYTRCEYLKANQNGFIPTDITLSNNSSVEIVATIDSMTNLYNGAEAMILQPTTYGSPMVTCGFRGYYNKNTGEYWLNARTYNSKWEAVDIIDIPFDTEKHTYVIDLKNKVLSVDDNTTAITLSNTDYDLTRTYVWAFCRSVDANNPRGGHKRIYSIIVKENDVVTHELVPALNAKGTACLYDLNTGHSWYYPGSDKSAITGKVLE